MLSIRSSDLRRASFAQMGVATGGVDVPPLPGTSAMASTRRLRRLLNRCFWCGVIVFVGAKLYDRREDSGLSWSHESEMVHGFDMIPHALSSLVGDWAHRKPLTAVAPPPARPDKTAAPVAQAPPRIEVHVPPAESPLELGTPEDDNPPQGLGEHEQLGVHNDDKMMAETFNSPADEIAIKEMRTYRRTNLWGPPDSRPDTIVMKQAAGVPHEATIIFLHVSVFVTVVIVHQH